jgi:poly(A) polymerase
LPTNLTEDPLRKFAVEVVEILKNQGYLAYFAGGCVRDILLGLIPSDYDVATNATPERVLKLFRRTVKVGLSFGVVRVVAPKGGWDVEVATFRSDGVYSDGRRPDSVTYGDAKEDALRRDFTINGMFMDPLDHDRVIDFVGGRDDLARRILRAIGNPRDRFTEDKLRLIRAVRFAARFDLTMDPLTEQAIRDMADQLGVVAFERIAQEFRKMLAHSSRARAVSLCRDLGLMPTLLPNLPQEAYQHQADWLVLPTLSALPDNASFETALAAVCNRLDPTTLVANLKRLRLSNPEIKRIAWLAEHRHDLDHARELPRHRLKRVLAHPYAGELIVLARAEAIARGDDTTLANIDWADAYRHDLPDGPLDPPWLVSGHDLVALGVKPGPRFAALLEAIRDRQLDGLITDRNQALDLIRRQVSRSAPEPTDANSSTNQTLWETPPDNHSSSFEVHD